MKRALFGLVLVGLFASSGGCAAVDRLFCPGGKACGGCSSCDPGYVDPGPTSAAVTYPYYTTRGPRDFLACEPRGIGP